MFISRQHRAVISFILAIAMTFSYSVMPMRSVVYALDQDSLGAALADADVHSEEGPPAADPAEEYSPQPDPSTDPPSGQSSDSEDYSIL